MNRNNGVRRTYRLPEKLVKEVEDAANAQLKAYGSRITKTKRATVCRNIICIAIKRQLPLISKMTMEEFEQQSQHTDDRFGRRPNLKATDRKVVNRPCVIPKTSVF
jgi:hypothetical protein